MQISEYVQFGGGSSTPEGWLNFDVSPTLRFERLPLIGKLYTRNVQRFPRNVRYGDIVRGLPIQDGSCRGIYCSHVLEHLALDEVGPALRNVCRYLRPGGTFRLVLPDLERLARDDVSSTGTRGSLKFMEDTYLGVKCRPRGLGAFVRSWLGNSAHLWMWDERFAGRRVTPTRFQGNPPRGLWRRGRQEVQRS